MEREPLNNTVQGLACCACKYGCKYKDPKGLIARKKYFWLSMGALFVGVSLYYIATLQPDINTTREMQDLLLPVFKDWMIPFSAVPFGIGFIIFTYNTV